MYIGYDLELWKRYGVRQNISMEIRSHPGLLLTGSSGSGKSYALKYLIHNLLISGQSDLTFCNFKKSEDFRFLHSMKSYYTYLDCAKGVDDFYNNFKKLQDKEDAFTGRYHILIFDEFPAFILSTAMQDKKLAERYKAMISELLMLGRSYGFGVWLVMQRPDNAFFANGARDNFHTTISLGNLSKESKSMLYSGEELPDTIYKVGEGICWIDGMGLRQIKYPKIQNLQKLESMILNRLDQRPQGSCSRRDKINSLDYNA